MNQVAKLIALLEGRKTYIVSLLTTLDGVVQLIQGHHLGQVLPFLFAGAFGGSLRAAVAKVENKLPAPVQTVVDPMVAKAEGK